MLLRSGALGMNGHPEGASAMRRISAVDPRRSFTSCYSVQDDIETQAYSPSSLEGSPSDRRISRTQRGFFSRWSSLRMTRHLLKLFFRRPKGGMDHEPKA